MLGSSPRPPPSYPRGGPARRYTYIGFLIAHRFAHGVQIQLLQRVFLERETREIAPTGTPAWTGPGLGHIGY